MSIRRAFHKALAPLIYGDGSALVPSLVAAEWPERRFLRRLLNRLDVDCVIDVGANVGQYAKDLRLIGFRGTILSFEPSPAVFETLSQVSSRDPNWHVFNYALGDDQGELPFNVMQASEFSSFREPSTEDTSHVAFYNRVATTITVRVDRLDTVLPSLRARYGFSRPFLKTDTQGYDIEVFRGASAVHDELLGAQCELAIKRIYEDVPLWGEAIAQYSSKGFELAGIFAVSPREDELFECNAFFVKK